METEIKNKFGKLNVIRVNTTVEDKKLIDVSLDVTNGGDEFDDGYSQQALILNQYGGRKPWLEGVFTLLVELSTQRLSLSKKSYESKLTEQDINIDIAHFVKSLGMTMGYFINSTSWREQELKDFDRQELKNRLQRLISQL